jgi:hypothetical protein
VVSGGGINSKNKWVKEKRKQGNFLFPTQALSTIYKAVFLKLLNKAYQANKIQLLPTQNFSNILIQATTKHWLVYAKAPFAGPEKVINYLGRYTHKTAITTNRITNITAKLLSFTYKDYRDNNKQKLLTLSHEEFLRRFEQHILPAHFVRIRHGGYLAHNGKNKRLKKITKQLKLKPPPKPVKLDVVSICLMRYGKDISQCPKCTTGKLQLVATYVMYNGSLVNVRQLNKGSPNKTKL